jgi:hypothetical protein
MYTPETFIPRARPLLPSGKTEVIMAVPVAATIVLPIPCPTRDTISISQFTDIPAMAVATVNTMTPSKKIRFRPVISANFPEGRRNTAADSRKELGTQLIWIAFICKSLASDGNAIFTDESKKGVRNAPMADIISTVRCSLSIADYQYFFNFQ